MISSDGFGGGAAGARPRVQVCPTAGTEAGTIVPAQQEVTRQRERELFPDDGGDINARGPRWQGIEIRVVRGFGITGKDRSTNLEIYLFEDLRETPPALAAYHGVDGATPKVFTLARRLQLSVDQNTTDQVEVETVEGWIAGAELAFGPRGTALQLPDIHSQHSPLR